MARVGIIGGGAFGTAMACVIRRSGHEAVIWAREPEVVQSINRQGVNALFLPGISLAKGVRATDRLGDAMDEMDFVLTAVPAQHLRTIAGRMRPSLVAGTPVVSCSKGIERGSCALMPEVLAESLPGARIAVLSGPSFAREIAQDLPCGVVLACADFELAKRLAGEIGNPRFCVHPSDDVHGAAIGGVMKNVIAIASGIAAGRKLGENARATLLALGLEEATRLGLAKDAAAATFTGLAGAGDMALTCGSLQSRNTSLGFALGEGRQAAEVLAARREVTEGAFSAEAVAALADSLGVPMPISSAVHRILNRGADLEAEIARMIGPR